MRISDWSSDVCSSDLTVTAAIGVLARRFRMHAIFVLSSQALGVLLVLNAGWGSSIVPTLDSIRTTAQAFVDSVDILQSYAAPVPPGSEEHTSELQSLMRISYAVFCLKKKKIKYR